MPISEQDRARIEVTARAWLDEHRWDESSPRAIYIAGATAEVARYAPLVEALTEIANAGTMEGAWMRGRARAALAALREQP